MASAVAAERTAANGDVQAIIKYGTEALDSLRNSLVIPDHLERELESPIQCLPSIAASAEDAQRLDMLGTDLWNAAANVLHHDQQQIASLDTQRHSRTRLGVQVRVFAFLLLDLGYRSASKYGKNEAAQLRIAKIALQAGRLCLGCSELDYALHVLERCAEHVAVPGSDAKRSSDTSEQGVEAKQRALQAEYCLLRIMYAWKVDRSDTAHHFYLCFCAIDLNSPIVAEKAADLFWCIAKSMKQTGSHEAQSIIVWLERGLATLDACQPTKTTKEATQLRLAVTSCLGVMSEHECTMQGLTIVVDLLLSTRENDNVERASDIVDSLGSKLSSDSSTLPYALKVEVNLSRTPVDTDVIRRILVEAVQVALPTDGNVKTLLQAASRVANFSLHSSLACLNVFICTKLLPEQSTRDPAKGDPRDWLVRSVVTYIYLLASRTSQLTQALAADLTQLLDTILQHVGDVLSQVETHACQSLICKIVQCAEKLDSLQWCALMQHPLFARASSSNKAWINRRTILSALKGNNILAARHAFDQMPTENQNETRTRYLAFKVALCSKDTNLAHECLTHIATGVETDANYLYACVLDAQQSEARHIARLALQTLIVAKPEGIVLYSLLRGVATLLIAELNESVRKADEVALDISELLAETTLQLTSTTTNQSGDWPLKEIEWWAKNSYNLALRTFARINLTTSVKFLSSCLYFLEIYKKHSGSETEHVQERELLCNFLCATAMVTVGRSHTSGSEDALQAYRDVQHHVTNYKALQTEMQRPSSDGLDAHRTLEMLKYELEGILKLDEWDKVDAALRACLELQCAERWDTLADLLVLLHEHMNHAFPNSPTDRLLTEVLQKVINETWRRDKDIAKVARWLRCTFCICLADRQSNFSFKLLQQAASMAANGRDGRHDRYPEQELQWLAASSFNRALDLVADGEPEAAEEWMGGALELAACAQDGGTLHRVLTHRREITRQQRYETSG